MGKYDHIDFKPPESVAKEAARGLDLRDEHNRGGTDVGIQRARNLKNRDTISPAIIKKMYSFFSRHEVDKKGKGWKRGSEGYPSNGLIAWKLWGGDPGFSWAKKVRNQMEAADKKSKKGSVAPKSIRYHGATYQLVEADGYMTLYHIGERPPRPQLKFQTKGNPPNLDPDTYKEQLREMKDLGIDPFAPGYRRPWLGNEDPISTDPTGPVVFLSDDPVGIWANHGIMGNVYAYKVPMWVVKKAGGLNKLYSGREILITEELWPHVQFLGKLSEQKFRKMLKDRGKPYDTPFFIFHDDQPPSQHPPFDHSKEEMDAILKSRKLEHKMDKRLEKSKQASPYYARVRYRGATYLLDI